MNHLSLRDICAAGIHAGLEPLHRTAKTLISSGAIPEKGLLLLVSSHRFTFMKEKNQDRIAGFSYEYCEIGKLLIPFMDSKEIRESFLLACQRNSLLALALVPHVQNINFRSKTGMNSVLYAVANGFTALALELMLDGADYNMKNHRGMGIFELCPTESMRRSLGKAVSVIESRQKGRIALQEIFPATVAGDIFEFLQFKLKVVGCCGCCWKCSVKVKTNEIFYSSNEDIDMDDLSIEFVTESIDDQIEEMSHPMLDHDDVAVLPWAGYFGNRSPRANFCCYIN